MTMVDIPTEIANPANMPRPSVSCMRSIPTISGSVPAGPQCNGITSCVGEKNERKRLIAQRLAISNDQRIDRARRIGAHLDMLLPDLAGISVSLYWPFRGEPDLRGWAAAIRARGATCALPVVVQKNAPLIFRLWRTDEPLAPGVWNIPIPVNSPELVPDVVIAPVVGFDEQGYRLGYGGGFTTGLLPP